MTSKYRYTYFGIFGLGEEGDGDGVNGRLITCSLASTFQAFFF